MEMLSWPSRPRFGYGLEVGLGSRELAGEGQRYTGRSDQGGDVGVFLGEGGVEGGDATAAAAGELGEPGIGDLAVAEEAGGIDFEIGEGVVPKDVVRVF